MPEQLITITEYCSLYSLDPVFLTRLEEDGIIELTIIGNQQYLQQEQIPELETYQRWYYELGINTEGIDVVRHLLQKIRLLQDEIKMLNKKLSLYE